MRLLIEKAIAHLETPSRQKAIQALDHSAPLAELLQLANADRPKNAEAWREVLSLALGAEIEQENARTLYQGAWWSAMLRGGQLHSGEPLQDVYTGLINNRAIIDQIAIVHGDPEMPVVVLHAPEHPEHCLHCTNMLEGLTDIRLEHRGEQIVIVHGTCTAHEAEGEQYLDSLRELINEQFGLPLETLLDNALSHEKEAQPHRKPRGISA